MIILRQKEFGKTRAFLDHYKRKVKVILGNFDPTGRAIARTERRYKIAAEKAMKEGTTLDKILSRQGRVPQLRPVSLKN